jgi:LysM repeat protein
VITYTVQSGDTLLSIAAQHGIDLATLNALNPQVTPEFLNVGDELTLPAPAGSGGDASTEAEPVGDQDAIEYTVAAGDTLAAIAARFGVTIDAIVRQNNLSSPDQIREGQTLRIPASTSPVSEPAATQPAIPTETGEPPPDANVTPGA